MSARQKSKLALTKGISFSRSQLIIVASAFVLFGLIAILVSRAATTVTVTVDTNTVVGTSKMQTGVTHTQYDIYPHTNGTSPAALAAQDILKTTSNWQNQHIFGWGAGNPQPYPPTATSDNINWTDIDGRVNMMRKTGNAMAITLCCAPDWMKGGAPGTTDWSKLESAPLPEHVGDYANLAAKVAQRYPDIKYFQVWNEMKGMYGLSTPGCTPTACGQNRWDYERYTTLYNAIWDKVKAVRPDAQIGGPYVVMDHWGTTNYSHPSFYPAKDRPGLPYYGDIDKRTLDVVAYWLKNKRGADFITLDGKLGNRDGTKLVSDFDAAQSWVDIYDWVRKLDPAQYPGANTLPFWWAEWYAIGIQEPTDPSLNNAIMANSLIYTLKSGANLPLIWEPNGNSAGHAFPLGLYTGVHPTANGGAGSTDGGKPTLFTPVQKGFKDYFQPGTELTKVTVSDPNQVVALASKTKILLVNKTAGDVIAVVNGVSRNLSPYQVLFTDVSGSTATLSANITTPANGATVSGGIPVEAKPTSPNGISKVEFYLDNGTTPYRTEAAAPYCMAQDSGAAPCYNWDSNSVANGSHSITAYAYDSAGVKSPASTVTFTVNNGTTSNPSGQAMPVGDIPGWQQIFTDDFTTQVALGSFPSAAWSKTDTRRNTYPGNKWSAYPSGWRDTKGGQNSDPTIGGWYNPEKTISVNNGMMDLWMHTELLDGVKKRLVSAPMPRIAGPVTEDYTAQLYGRYAVRFRVDPTRLINNFTGYKTAWLLWPSDNVWPKNGEIDFPEGNLNDTIHGYLHKQDATSGSDQYYALSGKRYTDWHTAVIEWGPGRGAFYLDGALITNASGGKSEWFERIPNTPMRWVLQSETELGSSSVNPAENTEGHIQIDWVAAYKPSTTNPGDTTAPTVAWEVPAAGATISGQLTEAANNCRVAASDGTGSGVERVEFFLDGTPINTERTAPYNCFVVDTTKYPNGSHVLGAKAYDVAGNSSALVTRSVTFNNVVADTTPPSTTITSPANNASVSGTFTATTVAADPPSTTNGAGISRVEYYLDATSGTPKVIEYGVPYEYTIDSLTISNGIHTITARSFDAAGNSSASTVSINVQNVDTQPPNPPSSLSGVTTQPTASTPASVGLSWSAATDNGSPASGIKGYYVYRGSSVVSPLISGTSYTDSNVLPGTHAYTVRSVDNVSLTSTTASPSYSTTINVVTDTTAPSTPTNVSANATSSSQVNLAWGGSTDVGGSGLRGYNIYRNGSTAPINVTPIVTTSYGDTSVTPATSYVYQVEAVDYAGNASPKSTEAHVSTPSAPTTLTILPAADAYVTQKFPTRTYGADNLLKADASPNQDVLLKFNVSGASGKTVKSAKLRLYVSQSSAQGGSLYKLISSNWSETSVSWATVPVAETAAFSTVGRAYGGSYVEIDLSSQIAGDGTYGFKLSSSSTDNVSYNSKEASSNKPQLVLVIE